MKSSSLANPVVVYTDGGFLLHNPASRYGHGGWAWWVNEEHYDCGPFLNAVSSDHVERLAVERALMAMSAEPRPVLVVCDNLAVVAAVRRALVDDGSLEWAAGWESFVRLVRERGPGRLGVLHTRGHGRGLVVHRQGNAQADRLATRARKAAARVIA